jgi:hypothetical protein
MDSLIVLQFRRTTLHTTDIAHNLRDSSCKTMVYEKQQLGHQRKSRETNLCSLQRAFSLLSVDTNCLKINSRESPSIYYLWIINVQKVNQIHP